MTTPPLNDTIPVWQNYVDLTNDVKPWLQFPAGSSAQDAQLQEVIDMACWWIQDYISRPVAPTTFFRRFSGWSGLNGAYVELPYYPVINVISVVEYWGTSGAHTLTEQTPANQGGQDVYQLVPNQGMLIRSFQGLVQRPWFPGSRNIEVTWVAGFEPIPPPIRMATKELIKEWWVNTQQGSRSFRGPNQGYDDNGMHDVWPGVPNRVTELLQTYLQVGMA